MSISQQGVPYGTQSNVILVQSKTQILQQQQQQSTTTIPGQMQQQQQHAHPPGMLAEETMPPVRRPSGLSIQTQNPNALLIQQTHQANASLTPQQVLAKNQAMAAQQQNHGGALQEQSLSGSYYSDDEGDAESSDDESPRENRVLTFADEHGKNLVAIHWYEPDPGEDNRGVNGVNTVAAGPGEEVVEGGCGGKCVIL